MKLTYVTGDYNIWWDEYEDGSAYSIGQFYGHEDRNCVITSFGHMHNWVLI